MNSHWTVAQAIVWIMTRDAGIVDAASELAERRVYGVAVWLLDLRRQRATPKDAGGHHLDQPPVMNFAAAKAELLSSLMDGRIEASGNPDGTFDRQTIPDLFWSDAEFFDDGGGDLVARAKGQSEAAWSRIRFKPQALLLTWKPLGDAAPDVIPQSKPERMKPKPQEKFLASIVDGLVIELKRSPTTAEIKARFLERAKYPIGKTKVRDYLKARGILRRPGATIEQSEHQ